MENRQELLKLLRGKFFLPEDNLSSDNLEDIQFYPWLKTSIQENYPATYKQFEKWGVTNNYLVFQAWGLMNKEDDLWEKGHQDGTQIEIAKREIISRIKDELEPLETLLKSGTLTSADLDMNFFSEKFIEELYSEPSSPEGYNLLPLFKFDDDDNDDYDLDKNPFIESKS